MSESEERDRKQQPPYLDSALVIDTRLSEIERQQREEKAEQKKHNRSQRTTNWLLTIFTGLLFVTSVTSDVLILRQVGRSSSGHTSRTGKYVQGGRYYGCAQTEFGRSEDSRTGIATRRSQRATQTRHWCEIDKENSNATATRKTVMGLLSIAARR